MASSSSTYDTFEGWPAIPQDSNALDNEHSGLSGPVARNPQLTRFLSDFTLGFSDGLTVPFALTAGLSSLGSTSTVISAGLAELCAGSISMGIGGYLAAIDELPCPPPAADATHGVVPDSDAEQGRAMERRKLLERRQSSGHSSRLSAEEKLMETHEDRIRQHLGPLALPQEVTASILTELKRQPGGLSRTVLRLEHELEPGTTSEPLPVSPVASGLSISLGYVIGGVIPLLPYFFASTVGSALRWSIGLCLVALYLFGSGKSWVLRREGSTWRRCVLEGLQMVVLGGLAAGAAILCVNLLEGDGDD